MRCWVPKFVLLDRILQSDEASHMVGRFLLREAALAAALSEDADEHVLSVLIGKDDVVHKRVGMIFNVSVVRRSIKNTLGSKRKRNIFCRWRSNRSKNTSSAR